MREEQFPVTGRANPGSVELANAGSFRRARDGGPEVDVPVVDDRRPETRCKDLRDLWTDPVTARTYGRPGEDRRSAAHGTDGVGDDTGHESSPPRVRDTDASIADHENRNTVGAEDGERLAGVVGPVGVGGRQGSRRLRTNDIASVHLANDRPPSIPADGLPGDTAVRSRVGVFVTDAERQVQLVEGRW